MPLNNVQLPASCYGLFSDLISVTAFDIFEPAEHFDLNITETLPYTNKFEWLGYPSKNIIENMGSILILLLIIIIQGFIILLLHLCRIEKACLKDMCSSHPVVTRTYNKWLNVNKYSSQILRFFLETFIELLICCAISQGNRTEVSSSERTFTDNFSIVITSLLLCILTAFVGVVFWFSFCKSKNLYLRKKQEK